MNSWNITLTHASRWRRTPLWAVTIDRVCTPQNRALVTVVPAATELHSGTCSNTKLYTGASFGNTERQNSLYIAEQWFLKEHSCGWRNTGSWRRTAAAEGTQRWLKEQSGRLQKHSGGCRKTVLDSGTQWSLQEHSSDFRKTVVAAETQRLRNTAFAKHSVCETQRLRNTAFAKHSVCETQRLRNTAFAKHSVCKTQRRLQQNSGSCRNIVMAAEKHTVGCRNTMLSAETPWCLQEQKQIDGLRNIAGAAGPHWAVEHPGGCKKTVVATKTKWWLRSTVVAAGT